MPSILADSLSQATLDAVDDDFEEACRRSIAEAEQERLFFDSMHDTEFEEACRLSLIDCGGYGSNASEDNLAAIQASNGEVTRGTPYSCLDDSSSAVASSIFRRHAQLSPPQELHYTAGHSLAVVIKRLSDALASHDGVLSLSLSCPFPIDENDRIIFEELLNKWLENFLRTTESMPVDIGDDDAMRFLKVALRGIMQLVAIWYRDGDHVHIVNLTKDWIVSVLVNVTGGLEAEQGINMKRLFTTLSVASGVKVSEGEDVSDALLNIGCKPDCVSMLQEDVALALLKKSREWEDTEEEDIFTCRQLVVNGRLAAGLGIVVRRSMAESAVHVFAYDLNALRNWVERSHQDPSTRQPLDVGGIVEIS